MTEQEQLQNEIIRLIEQKAESHGFQLTKNLQAIARAKLRVFGVKDWTRCPCDRNSDRGCISAHCLADIEKDGVCHCNLYTKGETKC